MESFFVRSRVIIETLEPSTTEKVIAYLDLQMRGNGSLRVKSLPKISSF